MDRPLGRPALLVGPETRRYRIAGWPGGPAAPGTSCPCRRAGPDRGTRPLCPGLRSGEGRPRQRGQGDATPRAAPAPPPPPASPHTEARRAGVTSAAPRAALREGGGGGGGSVPLPPVPGESPQVRPEEDGRGRGRRDGAGDGVGVPWQGARGEVGRRFGGWKSWAQLDPWASPAAGVLPAPPHLFGGCFRAAPRGRPVSRRPARRCLSPSAPAFPCPHLIDRSLRWPRGF